MANEQLLCSKIHKNVSIGQMPTGKKANDFIQESENTENKTPMFICKGPSCIMQFLKGIENMKWTGGRDKKETTFYSGW
ncbi:UNVERIFIED_CONTAM: hypothetical protein NCL1_50443 [Trichonephila clavipes]